MSNVPGASSLGFFAGAVVGTVLVGTVFCAGPHVASLPLLESHAWLWRADARALERIPFSHPMAEPTVSTAADGTVFASSGGECEHFDPRKRAFTRGPDLDAAPKAPVLPDRIGWRFDVDSFPVGPDRWFYIERRASNDAGRARHSGLVRDTKLVDGPQFPPAAASDAVVVLGDGTIAVLDRSSAVNAVYLAKVEDPAFLRVELGGESLKDTAVSITAADGRDLLVVAHEADGPPLVTRIVDSTSGAVTEGPSLDFPAGDVVLPLSGSAVPGGGVLFALGRRRAGPDPDWETPRRIAIGVAVGEVALVALAIARRWFTLAFWIGAAVSLAFFGLVYAFFSQVAAGLAHM